MRVAYEIYDPAKITVDEAEALRDAGLILEMTPDKSIIASFELGNIFDREEDKRNERDIS